MIEPINPKSIESKDFVLGLRELLKSADVSYDAKANICAIEFEINSVISQFLISLPKSISLNIANCSTNKKTISIDINNINKLISIYPEILGIKAITTKFGFKVIRADEWCFIFDFVLMMTGGKQIPLRPKIKSRFTTKGHGVSERFEAEPTHTAEQKAGLSKANSISIATEHIAPEPYGIGKYRGTKIVGVIIDLDDALLGNRFFLADFGTVERPYDAETFEKAQAYFAKMQGKLFGNLEDFLKAYDAQKDPTKRNEILARFRWNKKTSKLFIGSDTLAARLLAQEYAKILLNRLKEQAISNGEAWDETYDIPICFYQPGLKKPEEAVRYSYDIFNQAADRTKARKIYNDLPQRTKKYQERNYEFLLALEDADNVINETLPDGKKLLIEMLNAGSIFIVQALLNRTKDPDILTKIRIPPEQTLNDEVLKFAVIAGDARLVRWLLANYPSLDISDALHFACIKDRVEIVEILFNSIYFETRIAVLNQYITKASAAGAWDVVKYLIDNYLVISGVHQKNNIFFYKSDLRPTAAINLVNISQAKDLFNSTIDLASYRYILREAARANMLDIVRKLYDKKQPLHPHDDGNTAIHWAARHKNHEMMQVFLEENFDGANLLKMKNSNGKTIIDISTDKKDIKMLLFYLTLFISDDQKQSIYNHILLIAAETNQFDLARRVVLAGAAPQFRTKNGYTALHWAVFRRDAPLLALLLSHPISSLDILDDSISLSCKLTRENNDQTSADCFITYCRKFHQKLLNLRAEVSKNSYCQRQGVLVHIPKPINQLRELLKGLPADPNNFNFFSEIHKIYFECTKIIHTQHVSQQVKDAFDVPGVLQSAKSLTDYVAAEKSDDARKIRSV